jgi:hypothetical protein
MWKCISVVVLALAVVGLALPTPAAHAGPTGSSKSDQPSYTVQLNITNNSSQRVTYFVWFGKERPIADTLNPGDSTNFYHPSDSNGNAPQPHIKFVTAVSGKKDWKFYDLNGYLVTDGQAGTVGSPNAYEFDDAANNSIDFFHS